MIIRCPYCNGISAVRTTKKMSDHLKSHRMVCTNYKCGHIFVILVEFSHSTVLPFGITKPKFPIGDYLQKRLEQLKGHLRKAR